VISAAAQRKRHRNQKCPHDAPSQPANLPEPAKGISDCHHNLELLLRRIAANIAKLPELVRRKTSPAVKREAERGLGVLRNLNAWAGLAHYHRQRPFQASVTESPLRSRLKGKERAMLKNLRDEIRWCLQRAEDCAQKAAAESDPKIKADFLDKKRRWTALAGNYDFANQLNDETKLKTDKLPKVRTRY